MEPDSIAVIDVGKTRAKLLAVDARSGEIVWEASRAVESHPGPTVRELDIHGIWSWLLAGLRQMPCRSTLKAIVPVAHGAAVVLLDAKGTVLCAPDYEDAAFNAVAPEYRRERDSFGLTLSPDLPLGLNLGRQLYFLQQRAPQLHARCAHLLLYPQYWAWRLGGRMASECTSLGTHTDLWDPKRSTFSPLAIRRGWAERFPQVLQASEDLGRVAPDVIAAADLPSDCRVLCGLHDSNASYLAHLATHSPDEPFAVISSGTWTVVMARGTDLNLLRPEWDMLANVDAFSSPVATARFMGGRDYAAVAGDLGAAAPPSGHAIGDILRSGIFALPSFAEAGGPFLPGSGTLVGAEGLDATGRATLATLYIALMCDLLLNNLKARGPVIVDGPLARNPLFSQLLTALIPEKSVYRSSGSDGIASAALFLANGRIPKSDSLAVEPLALTGLEEYRRLWRSAAFAAR